MESLNTEKARTGAESTKKAAGKLADQAANIATDAVDELSTAVSGLTDKGLELARDQIEVLRAESAEWLGAAEKSIRKNPLAAVAIAAGVGVIVAGLAGLAARGFTRS